ncbi:pyridoxal phosphate-dependent aminotransferase [Clostridium sp. DL1XJH146]
MIAQKYKKMLEGKSVIREFFDFAGKRGAEIGYENVFDYSLGNPSVKVPEKFTEVVKDLLDNKSQQELHGYSPSLGIISVRTAIAESLNNRFNMDYETKHIFMTSGAAGALAHAIRCVTVENDEIIAFAPYFPEYFPYVELMGATLKIVPPKTDDFQIDFAAFENLLNPNVQAIIINTPNNPSGSIYTEDTLIKLTSILRKKEEEYGHEIFIISDDPYREIIFDNNNMPYISKYYNNTISCYSFSKSLSLPGERIGYLAVNPKAKGSEYLVAMCGQISRAIGHNCPPSIIQLAVAEVLEMTSDMSVYETNMNILYNKLIELGFQCVKPSGTFYIFPKALEEDANAFCRKALKYDLILVPGDSFGCPGYFRMAFCIDTEKVKRSLAALDKFVNNEYRK